MSSIKYKDPIIIRLEWYSEMSGNEYEWSGSKIVSSDALPGIEFKILVTASFPGQLRAVISKTLCDPANAIICLYMHYETFLGKTKLKTIEVDDWSDDCEFGCFIPISKEGTAFFECEITWRGFNNKLPTLNLYHNMRQFFATPELADITIIIDKEEIPVHKIVLAAQSPVFLAMFTTNMTESTKNQIIVDDIEVDIMKKVIEFLYTGKVEPELDVDVLLSIFIVANKYQIMDLKDVCVKFLSAKLQINNVLQILEISSLYSTPELFEKASTFMIKNNHEIFKLENLEDFTGRNPSLFFKYVCRLKELKE